MPEALPEIVPLALLFLCFAFVWAARKLLAAMFGTLIDAVNAVGIPYLGGAISGALHTMEQAIDSALGSVEHGIDSLMGSCWHRFAQLNGWLWSEFKQHSLIGWLLSQEISLLTHGYHYLHGRVTSLSGLHAWVNSRLRSLEREYHGIEHRVGNLEHDLTKGIGHDLRIGVRDLEREVGRIEHSAIPSLRAAERDAADAIGNLYEWAKGKASLLGVGTFALAVAAALEALGLGGLRCPSFLRNLNRRGCGMWNGIEDVLGLFVDLFIITDLCEVIPLLETAYADVAAPAVGLLTEAIDAMPCVAGNQPPALTVPRLYLPASPSLALALP